MFVIKLPINTSYTNLLIDYMLSDHTTLLPDIFRLAISTVDIGMLVMIIRKISSMIALSNYELSVCSHCTPLKAAAINGESPPYISHYRKLLSYPHLLPSWMTTFRGSDRPQRGISRFLDVPVNISQTTREQIIYHL